MFHHQPTIDHPWDQEIPGRLQSRANTPCGHLFIITSVSFSVGVTHPHTTS